MAIEKTRKMFEEHEPFELIELLGAGGFAQTYKARVLDDILIDEFGTNVIALKIPFDPRKEQILRHEIETNTLLHARLRGLRSVNLVRYLGFAVFRGSIAMAMQYAPDGNLRKIVGRIGSQKPLPINQAIRITEGVLTGLVILHNTGKLFHRDIKLENILFDGDTPMVADFGISRMLESDELASTTAGSPYYISPEILWLEGASFPSDIWSLGVAFYEMVTGQLPFGGSKAPVGCVYDAIRRAEPLPPSELRPDLPRWLNDLILRSLQRDPRNRFGSAQEMLDALRSSRGSKIDEKLERELASLGELISRMESPGDVEEKLKKLLTQYPNQPRIYQHLGEFYNRCQRYLDAITAFEKGIETDPDNALLHWDLALALQRKGQKKDAAKHLERAIELGLDASLHRYASTLLKVLQGS